MAELPTNSPELEVAIAGEGVTPADISVRHLAEILGASAAALEAVAQERGLKLALPSLERVQTGSATFVLTSRESTWELVVEEFYEVVRSRATRAGARVRAALVRLFESAKIGPLRIRAVGVARLAHAEPLFLARPLEEAGVSVDFSTVVHGRIVGVNAYADHTVVRIALDDGGRQDFDADDDLAARAGRLFNGPVRATVVSTWTADRTAGRKLLRLERWVEADFLESLKAVRAELTDAGVSIDAAGWLKELEDS